MKKTNKVIVLILSLIFIFLNGCKSVKKNLTLKKKDSTDEFLVEKKNPLILPPDYEKMPVPVGEDTEIIKDESSKIKELVTDNQTKSENNNSENSNLEKSILEKINN